MADNNHPPTSDLFDYFQIQQLSSLNFLWEIFPRISTSRFDKAMLRKIILFLPEINMEMILLDFVVSRLHFL
jgi:hypothetical protein